MANYLPFRVFDISHGRAFPADSRRRPHRLVSFGISTKRPVPVVACRPRLLGTCDRVPAQRIFKRLVSQRLCKLAVAPGDEFTFNYYDRAGDFISFQTAEQFRPEAGKLAAWASAQAALLSKKFGSLDDIAAYLRQRVSENRDFWTLYNAAIAAGLTGSKEFSLQCFSDFIALEPTADWTHEIQAEAVTLRKLLADGREFSAAIQNKIIAKRAALKLPPLDGLTKKKGRPRGRP